MKRTIASHRWQRYPSSPASLLVAAIAFLGVVCSDGRKTPNRLTLLCVRGGSSPQFPPPPDDQQAEWFGQDPYLEQEERQTVQERVDAWRLQQQQIQYQEKDLDSQFDNQGRRKLLYGVSKTSRAIIFFVLMWRDVHLYELADQRFRGLVRLILVFPLMTLFVANLAGVVASFTSASHSSNKRLKAILNLDKFVEFILLVYYLLRLTIFPTSHVPREIYIANTIHSVVFILQCQAFTKLTWDDAFAHIRPRGESVRTTTISSSNIDQHPTYHPVAQSDQYPPYNDLMDESRGAEQVVFAYAPTPDSFPFEADTQTPAYSSSREEY